MDVRDLFLTFIEQLTLFNDALVSMGAETDTALLEKRENEAVRSFLDTTESFRQFLAGVIEDKRLLENDEEGIAQLEDTMASFKENNVITEDQFLQFGSLFSAQIIFASQTDKEDEIYREAVTYLPLFCTLYMQFSQALVDQQWQVEREL